MTDDEPVTYPTKRKKVGHSKPSKEGVPVQNKDQKMVMVMQLPLVNHRFQILGRMRF